MKTVIECTLGATEQTIGGITYSFDRDAHGRFVNEVNSVLHRSIFLNIVHYREVPLDPPPPDDEIPAFLSGQGGEGGGAGEGEGTGDNDGDGDPDDDDGSNSEGEGTGEGEGAGSENAPESSDADQTPSETTEQAEQAPVATPAKKATSKSK
ncbi:hypothetical protein [Agrobacterium radiobacter]|uniref:hypothetical protein n=1 Tax=Agrobacterium radiobacter TaxID=362 RepID=UPI003F838FBF